MHKPLKVLLTLDSLFGGGTETSTLELITQLSRETNITVCYFYNKHDLRDAYESAYCRLIYLQLPGKYSFLVGIKKLKALIEQEQFDVIVTSLYRASIMTRIVSFLTGTPLIDTMVNESYGKEKRKEFEGFNLIKYFMVFILDRLTSFIPKLWISNSIFLAGKMGRQLGVSHNKIKVIYRGRQGDNIPAWSTPPATDKFHFVSIGRLFPQKAHMDLIKAFSSLHQKHSYCDLTIYGEGPERATLEQLISDLNLRGFVFLSGRKDHAWDQLHKAHCFVLPSRYEGFSGALIEALMTGIPVIASDIPVNKEAVVNNKTGLLHKVNDIDDLSVKMEEVILHYEDAATRGRAARNEALAKYDIRKIATEYEEVLQRFARFNIVSET